MSQKLTIPHPRKKIDKTTLIVLSVIGVVLLIGCVVLGAAFDYALGADGSIDGSKISPALHYVLSHPAVIFSAITKKDGYVPKMLFVGICVIGIFALYKYSEEPKRLHRRGTEHGSAKWADEKEIHALASKEKPYQIALRDENGRYLYDDKGDFVCAYTDYNIVLAKEVYLALDTKLHRLNLNTLVIGGSGSGKTLFWVITNILQLNTSFVITDPKGEIYQAVAKLLQEAGYEVRVFNTIQMEHSNNYNPFHYIYDHNGDLCEDNVKKMADVLFQSTKGDGEKDDFWSQKGQTVLLALMFLLIEESEYNALFDENGKIIPGTRDETNLNFYAITEKMRGLQYPPQGSQKPDGLFLTKNLGESDEEFEARRAKAFLCPLDRDFLELERRKPNTLAFRLYKEIRNAPEETGQSFVSSANVKTFFFNLENLKNLTCCDNVHLETLGDKKTALFIIISATNSTYNFLASMMYTQLFDTLSNRANFKYHGSLPVHVRCLMDEMANIGQIPDFDKVIAFVRSMGMSLNVIIQNLAQLKARYEKTWEVITGNCDSTIFLGGKEETTLKSISEQLGKETIDVKGQNRTKGRQSSTSENNSILGRELMQPNEIATMPISDCICLERSLDPIYAKKYGAFDHPNFRFTGLADDANRADITLIRSVTVAEFMAEQKAQRAKAIQQYQAVAAATHPEDKQDAVIFTAAEPVVTAEEIPTSYEDILDMDSELSSVAEAETYADHTQYYGIPDDEIVSCDMGTASKTRKEEYEDEEAEITPAMIDEEEEITVIPEQEILDTGPFYDEIDEEPEVNPNLPKSDFTVTVLADDLPDATGMIGDSSLLGETFD
ncbi:MAG: type IV secretory system conjugative DNA transfer family protein [Oscillospiraceae bacterium]|nr:type IV secretory system conjugative DNA transfer family protein [Oscillospiraceae bacterium]MBR3448911.1 type IV secretory system conjugative DNA transfer family protein [Oscillospiraceae bacterium]